MGCVCEVEGKIHLDLFLQHKDLIGGCKLKLKLVPHRPEFYFMVNDSTNKLTPSIVFEDIHLNVVKTKASEQVVQAQQMALYVGLIKYIINRTEVRAVTIETGATSRNIENVIIGQLPRRIYLGFVSNDAYSGNYKKNPFAFDHCNITSLACFVNDIQFPQRAYRPNFEKDQYLREYIEFLNSLIITQEWLAIGSTIKMVTLSLLSILVLTSVKAITRMVMSTFPEMAFCDLKLCLLPL